MAELTYFFKMLGFGLILGLIANIALFCVFAKEAGGEKVIAQGISRKEYLKRHLFAGRLKALYLGGVSLGLCVAALDAGSFILRLFYGLCFLGLGFWALRCEYKGKTEQPPE